MNGWGGPLIIRELIQYPDGRIGSKWMKEVMPETETTQNLAEEVLEAAEFSVNGKSMLLTVEVEPAELKKGRFGISFLPKDGDANGSCELQVRLEDWCAQFGPGSLTKFGDKQETIGKRIYTDFAINNLIGVDKPFMVRVIVKTEEKFGGSVIDAEIAGQRTMITYRKGLTVNKLLIRAEGVELKNITSAPLNN